MAHELLENTVSRDLKRLFYSYLHPKAEAVVIEPDAYLIYIMKQREEREREMALEGEGVKIGLCQITEKSEELDSFQLMEAILP